MNSIKEYLSEVKAALESIDMIKINEILSILYGALIETKKVLIIGNGGSAALASHLACDLSKKSCENCTNKLGAISLTDSSMITAIANDTDFNNVFTHQIIALADPGDIFIAFSSSGNSKNILNACEVAKALRMKTIGIGGFKDNKMSKIVSINISVPTDHYGVMEDCQAMIAHMLTYGLKEKIDNEL